MEYNTTREKLMISEYGRNIQKMVKYITTLPDKTQRTNMANALVNVLLAMNPETKDNQDVKQKLFDHLHIMSDFTLDIDSEFPVPARPEDAPKPERVPYTQENIKLRPYGKYMQRIIEKAVEYEEGQEKEELVKTIANNLKKMYLNWNRDSVNDELIHEHLGLLSDDKLKLREDDKLNSTNEILKANKQGKNNARKRQDFKKKHNNRKNDNGHRKNFSK